MFVGRGFRRTISGLKINRLQSLCCNLRAKRFCSVGLQADTVDSSTCPPEGGRYIDQNQALTQTLQPLARRRKSCNVCETSRLESPLRGAAIPGACRYDPQNPLGIPYPSDQYLFQEIGRARPSASITAS